MMDWLYLALFGLVAGSLAKFLMPGRDPGGWIITILLGIGGSFVGAYLGSKVGIQANDRLGNLLVATGGAVVLLIAYRFLFKGK